MTNPKDSTPIGSLIKQGKITSLEDVFSYLDPAAVQERSGIEAERFAAIRQQRGQMLITEIHRLAAAIGIPPPELMDLLIADKDQADDK